MRIGVDGDHVVHGDEMRAAVALDRKVAGEAPRRAGAAERRKAAAAEFGIGVVAVAAMRRGRDRCDFRRRASSTAALSDGRELD